MKSLIDSTISKKYSAFYLLALFGCIYTIIVVCNHYFFRTYCWDYGVYNFAFYDIAHLKLSDNGAYHQSHVNFLQDHVSFTMYWFIPLYWAFAWLTGTYTLLLIQVIFILYGGWAVYKIIEVKTSDSFLAILALLQYLIIFGRWPSFLSDCNLAIIGSSMVPVLFYYFEKRRFSAVVLVFAFILTVREDMALWTSFIGVFFFLVYFKDKQLRLTALLIIAMSIIYFIIVFLVIIPLLETPFKKFTLFEYSSLGKNPTEAIKFVVSHPIDTFKLLFLNQSGDPAYDNVKFEFYYVYFFCGGFLLFYRPKYLILFIPLIAKKMLNDSPIRWSIELYYSIEFVSILPIVAFLIISQEKKKKLKYWLAGVVILSTFTVTMIKLLEKNRKLDWWGDSKYAFYKENMYKANFDVSKVYHYLDTIPANAKVSLSTNIFPHLAFRDKVFYFPRVEEADYIAVFDYDRWPLEQKEFDEKIMEYKKSGDYIEIVNASPLIILKRIK